MPPGPPGGYPPAGGSPTGNVDVGAAINWSFSKFGQNAGPLMIVAAVIMVVQLVGYFVSGLFEPSPSYVNCSGLTGQALIDCSTSATGNAASFLGMSLISTIIRWAFMLIAVVIELGLISVALKVTRGGRAQVADVWNAPNVVLGVIVSILFALAYGIGLILCILPGLFILWAWQFARYSALDTGQGVVESFKESWRLVRTNVGMSILNLLVLLVAGIVSAVTCGIGALVAMPFAALFMAHMYRQFRGEPIAA